jgi:hypothetical protein
MKRKRPRVRRKASGTCVGDRKSLTITDNDARGSCGGRGNREVTRMGGHMRRGAGVHEPITTAAIGASVGGGVEGLQQRGVDLRRRWCAVVGGRGVAWSSVVLRCRIERLMGGWSRPQDAREGCPRHRHGVGVDDAGPRIVSCGPGWRGRKLLGRRRVGRSTGALASVSVMTTATSATVPAVPAVPAVPTLPPGAAGAW